MGTQAQPATELLHRRKRRHPGADLADQGQRRQLTDPLDHREVQPHHVVENRCSSRYDPVRAWAISASLALHCLSRYLANAVCKFHAARASNCNGWWPARAVRTMATVWLRILRMIRWHRCHRSFA